MSLFTLPRLYNAMFCTHINYRQPSYVRRTKPPDLKISRRILQLSLRKLLKPGVKSNMNM